MRRLVLVLTVLALVVLGASSAVAAKSKPDLKVTGSAHAASGKLLGGFTVENQGTTTSPASTAVVRLVGSSPFRDTESTEAESLAAATTKFHIVHLAHLQDTEYPIAGVRTETEAVKAAGFPLTRIEVDGGHYDEPNEIENGHAVPGTDADLRTYLLPHIDDGWLAP